MKSREVYYQDKKNKNLDRKIKRKCLIYQRIIVSSIKIKHKNYEKMVKVKTKLSEGQYINSK